MEEYNDYQLGDMVRFTSEFYNDPYLYVPTYEVEDEIDAIRMRVGANQFETALSQIVAVVDGFWDDGVFVSYTLYGHKTRTNHYWFEVEPTGEKIVLNDPSRYKKTLFDLDNL